MKDFAEAPIITRLEDLIAEPSTLLGSIVNMTYDEAIVATNDFKVRAAGGVPQRCFLLAAPQPDEEDKPLEEIVLLSVQAVHPLDSSREFQSVRETIALSGKTDIDQRTQLSLQTLGFKCVIVGTFFKTADGFRFGGDVDRIRGNSLFQVYKPRGHALSLIASYSHPRPGASSAAVDSLDLGVVRYSETQLDPDGEARVFVNVEDFIGKKSAVFGMTRTGKSSTIKTIIQKVFQFSHQPGRVPIGQIIFDPQGEYANVNSQDGNSALSQIGDDDEIRIYKMLFGKRESPKERHLQFNLFHEENLDLTWQLMTGELRSGISGDANYIQPLFDLSFARPAEGSPTEAWGAFKRKQLALYALMGRSKFHSEVADFSVYIGEDLAGRAAQEFDEIELAEGKTTHVTVSSTHAAVELFQFLMKYEQELPDFWKKDMKDGTTGEIKTQLLNLEEGRNGVIGAFNRIKPLHNDSAVGDVRDKIWRDLEAGRLVIVDLSRGSSRTTTTLSEMIVGYLVNQSSRNFVGGKDAVPYQIIVEEAHNLFRREGAKSDGVDPWVRLSKEAAKYSIGMVYATQEVTGVDSQILSNTSNWIVAHLNSRIETNELAKYYSFGSWADHLLRVETKGFVRMKTESSPYVVPVQIDKFVAQAKAPAKRTVKKSDPVIAAEPAPYSEDEYDAL